MSDILKLSQSIKKEAKELLCQYNVIETLEKFGEVKFTGSYELDLMYKKDIDLSLVNDSLTATGFTELGKELIDRLNTPTAYYRNTKITPVEKRPENAFYWGIKTGDWFLDIWGMKKEVYLRAEKYLCEIKSKLNEQNKIIILQLKSELLSGNSYGNKFGSRELYDAVLNNNVTSVQSFEHYLNKKAHLNEYR